MNKNDNKHKKKRTKANMELLKNFLKQTYKINDINFLKRKYSRLEQEAKELGKKVSEIGKKVNLTKRDILAGDFENHYAFSNATNKEDQKNFIELNEDFDIKTKKVIIVDKRIKSLDQQHGQNIGNAQNNI